MRLFAIALAASVCAAAPTPADTAIYQRFFDQVVQVNPGPAILNGQPSDYVQPGIGETLSLNAAEVGALTQVAAECRKALLELREAIKPAMFESRLRVADGRALPAALENRLKKFDSDQVTVLGAYILRLKTALGDTKFETLDTWIRSKSNEQSFFPLVRM